MAKCRIVLNSKGISELLRGAEMQNLLSGYADQMAGKSGGTAEVYVARTRAVAEVSGDNTDNRLLKGMNR